LKLSNFQAPDRSKITRTQLRGYGASSYLARQLTVALIPLEHQGRTSYYAIPDVISAIKAYLMKPRIRPTTQKILEQLQLELAPWMQNTIAIPFGTTGDVELKHLCLQVIRSKIAFDHQLAEAKVQSALLHGRNKLS